MSHRHLKGRWGQRSFFLPSLQTPAQKMTDMLAPAHAPLKSNHTLLTLCYQLHKSSPRLPGAPAMLTTCDMYGEKTTSPRGTKEAGSRAECVPVTTGLRAGPGPPHSLGSSCSLVSPGVQASPGEVCPSLFTQKLPLSRVYENTGKPPAPSFLERLL